MKKIVVTKTFSLLSHKILHGPLKCAVDYQYLPLPPFFITPLAHFIPPSPITTPTHSGGSGLLDSHFKTHRESGRIGRLEFLPISWHEALHGDASGVDAALKQITLGSIGRLRCAG